MTITKKPIGIDPNLEQALREINFPVLVKRQTLHHGGFVGSSEHMTRTRGEKISFPVLCNRIDNLLDREQSFSADSEDQKMKVKTDDVSNAYVGEFQYLGVGGEPTTFASYEGRTFIIKLDERDPSSEFPRRKFEIEIIKVSTGDSVIQVQGKERNSKYCSLSYGENYSWELLANSKTLYANILARTIYLNGEEIHTERITIPHHIPNDYEELEKANKRIPDNNGLVLAVNLLWNRQGDEK